MRWGNPTAGSNPADCLEGQKMMKAYEASVNSDSTEGRGYKVIVGYFLEKSDAEKVVKGRGPMGMSNGDVQPVWIFHNLAEYDEHRNKELRLRAWHKLTPEEREALNLPHQEM